MTLLLLLLGCQRSTTAPLEPELPEQLAPVEALAPRALLEQAASSEEPGHRAIALAALIRADGPEGDWAERALWDPSPWVQSHAARAVARTADDPSSRSVLAAWIARPAADPYARAVVAPQLTHWAPELGEAYLEGLQAETIRWRRAPLGLGAWLLGHDEGREVLLSALSRGDLALAPDFVAALVGAPDPQAVREALKEGEDWIEPELALAFAAMRLALGDGSADGLLRKALHDDDVGVRLEAVERVAALEVPAASSVLQRARHADDPLVAGRADLALAARPEEPTAPLVELATAADPELRAAARRAAGERLRAQPDLPKKARRDLEELVRSGLSDPNGEVRRAAVEAVGLAGLDVALLTPLLTDQQVGVRLEAAAAHIR